MITLVGYREESVRELDVNYSFMHPRGVYYHFMEHYQKYIKEDFVIGTMHSDIFNIVGDMIDHGLINSEDVKCVLIMDDGLERECGYDNEGYLDERYKYGYFLWCS